VLRKGVYLIQDREGWFAALGALIARGLADADEGAHKARCRCLAA
jgi:hypothetical protein